MTTSVVVDASVVVKWVVPEFGSEEALAVRRSLPLIAPDLLLAECANALWKRVELGELSSEEALDCARILAKADVRLHTIRGVIEQATVLGLELRHPVYDCIYLALALENGWRFITADERFVKKVRRNASNEIQASIVSLSRVQEILD